MPLGGFSLLPVSLQQWMREATQDAWAPRSNNWPCLLKIGICRGISSSETSKFPVVEGRGSYTQKDCGSSSLGKEALPLEGSKAPLRDSLDEDGVAALPRGTGEGCPIQRFEILNQRWCGNHQLAGGSENWLFSELHHRKLWKGLDTGMSSMF